MRRSATGLCLITLFLAACTGGPPEPEPTVALAETAAPIGNGTACTWASSVRNWKRASDDRILIQTTDGWFLAEVGGICDVELDDVLTVGITSTAGSVCAQDSVILNGQRCTIERMWKADPPSEKAASAN